MKVPLDIRLPFLYLLLKFFVSVDFMACIHLLGPFKGEHSHSEKYLMMSEFLSGQVEDLFMLLFGIKLMVTVVI